MARAGIAFEQQTFDGNRIQLRLQRLVQVRLSPLDDFRLQIPSHELVPTLQYTCGVAQWRHHMQRMISE